MSNEWASDVVIEEILRAFPRQIEERRRKLADPAWCASHPTSARHYHDPVRMRNLASALAEEANPFSFINMARRAAELETRMLNTAPSYRYVLQDPETGEVIDEQRFENDVDPSDPSVRAYVAELN